MPEESFEDRYFDVLQNIEAAIVGVYRADPELTDLEVMNTLDALIRRYRSEAGGREPRTPRLLGRIKDLYEVLEQACEWRLGRSKVKTVDGKEIGLPPEVEPLTPDEMVAVLKRIQRSVKRWTKEGGRQGYLNFVNEFIP